MNTRTASSGLEYYLGKLQPPYDSAGQAKIGRMLDEYGIPFFYKQPILIFEDGRRTIWHPDFTLPTYNSLVIEYDSAHHRAFDVGRSRPRSDAYRLNGIAALFLGPSDLARSDWQQRLYDRLEESYRQPLTYLRDSHR